MAHVGGQQEDVAFLEVDAFGLAVDPQREPGVAADLVERIPRAGRRDSRCGVGAADDSDDEVGVLPDLLVADGGLEQVGVVLDPALEVQGRAVGGHVDLRGGLGLL